MFQDCTPEEKYFSALRLLQGWDDNRIKKRKFNLGGARKQRSSDN